MKKNLLPILLFLTVYINAQVPEDVLRFSYYPQNGTARNLAIGGAMGSLGGDINATFVNPAGLGMYKTGEFVFTPGFFLNNNKTDFRSTGNKNNKNSFGIGTIGVVYGDIKRDAPNISQALSIAFTQTASFNNTYTYKGYNDYSSFSEQWAEEVSRLSNSGLSIDDIIRDPQYAYGSALALSTYIVDTFRINGNIVVKGLPEFVFDKGQALYQQNTVSTKGGLYELAVGYAMNKNDKFLLGGSIGIPIMSYNNTTTYTESDTSADLNNNFGYFTYKDQFKTSGAGINLKMGVIYKPTEFIRLGFALHTPTYMFTLTDRRSSFIKTQTEAYNQLDSLSSDDLQNGQPGESKYTMTTPLKLMVSGSYVFREIEDVRKQRGFITADIEYVNHKGSRFYSANENPTSEETAYFKELGKVIKQEYKGNFNFRLGGEIKFNTIMGRLGFAYYGNPYKDEALKAHKLLLSGGLGYRNKGFFVDLTYVHSFNKDVNFPYRLADKNNTFATVNDQRGNIIASVGFKF